MKLARQAEILKLIHQCEIETQEELATALREKGYQVTQGLIALGNGGLKGLGFGRSVAKNLYLPEPQNDFILAIIGEELGYIGFPLLDQFLRTLIHPVKIVGCEKEPVLPVRAEPGNIFLDRFHELDLFLGRIGIVKTQVERSVILFCKSVI